MVSKQINCHINQKAVLTAIIVIVLSTAFSNTFAQSDFNKDCSAVLERAEDAYSDGLIQKAIALLEKCPPEQFEDENEKLRAYKLMALAYVATGDTVRTANFNKADSTIVYSFSKADSMIFRLLDIDPEFEPEASQEKLVELVHFVKPRRNLPAGPIPRSGSKTQKWLIYGGGAIAAGVATFLFTQGGKESKKLRLPPGHPGSN